MNHTGRPPDSGQPAKPAPKPSGSGGYWHWLLLDLSLELLLALIGYIGLAFVIGGFGLVLMLLPLWILAAAWWRKKRKS